MSTATIRSSSRILIGTGKRSAVVRHALYDLLNAKYLIARKSAPVDRAKFKLAYEDAAFNVYENTRVLPRAFVVSDVRVVADHAAALDAIRANDFDPAQAVVLETADRRPPTTASTPAVSGQPSAVKIVGYGPNEILLDVNAPGAGVLVLSEVYYPGWRAWVNDREVEVLRADYLFRAVELPAGVAACAVAVRSAVVQNRRGVVRSDNDCVDRLVRLEEAKKMTYG